MHYTVILRITGGLLMLFSVALLSPVIVAFLYDESTTITFVTAFGITLGAGGVMWLLGSKTVELRNRDGFLVTVLFYLGIGMFAAIPLYLAPGIADHWTDAVFEALSGLTTTGATVLTGLDDLPRSILFYRQLLQWLGGMGIIVLAVAVLPMLGIGGMQLYRTEAPGPVKDAKFTPRIAQTARALWYLYIGLTAACAVAYWVAGMTPFDALCHAFSTVAIGGFSTHDASMGYFDSGAIESVAIVFMLLSGINFALHFAAVAQNRPWVYFTDREVRLYLLMILVTSVFVVGTLLRFPEASEHPFREGIFQAVSVATTTGFTTTNFSLWPSVAPILLLFVAFAGGCAGSTAGGLKQYRVLLMYRQWLREIRQLIHPNGVFHIKLAGKLVPDRVVNAVWGFVAAYVTSFIVMVCLLLMISDLDFISAFSAVAANLNNLGPGLGEVALNYQGLPDAAKWLLVVAMLLGRLEIFTLLVLLSPRYWRNL